MERKRGVGEREGEEKDSREEDVRKEWREGGREGGKVEGGEERGREEIEGEEVEGGWEARWREVGEERINKHSTYNLYVRTSEEVSKIWEESLCVWEKFPIPPLTHTVD